MTFQNVSVVSLVANPGGWTDELGNTDATHLINALLAIDGHYLQSPSNPTNAGITFELGAVQPPQPGTRAVHISAFTDGGPDEIDFTVNIRVHGSGTLLQSFNLKNVSGTESDTTLVESVDPANWAAVDLEILANHPVIITSGQTPEEFHGPYSSWNQITPSGDQTGALDSAHLQPALSGATPDRGGSPVVYLKPGNWYINKQLNMGIQFPAGSTQGLLGPMVLGHSRSDTTVFWTGGLPTTPGPAGSQGAGMFRHNGVTQMRFGRITFNGNGIANFGYMDAWDNSANFFPSGCRIEDFGVINLNPNSGLSGFESETLAMSLGPLGFGASEVSIFRCYFNFSTSGGPDSVGIMPYNFNALDIWVWDTQLIGMNMGICNLTNQSNAAGDFCAQRCAFSVTQRDFQIGNPAANYASRWNYSAPGAFRHIEAAPVGNFSCQFTVQGTTLSAHSAAQVRESMAGPVGMLDNKVAPVGPGDSFTISVQTPFNSDHSGELWSLGNQYQDTQTTAFFINGGATQLHTVDDQFSISYVDPGMPAIVAEPPAVTRPIHEPGAFTFAAIQTAINAAAAFDVVHIPYGNYTGNTTITVPANQAIFIEGDGPWTKLTWTGGGAGPVISFALPSLAIMRDVYINGAGVADCIGTSGTSSGGVIHMEGCTDSNVPAVGGLRAHNMGATIVDMLNCGIGNSSASSSVYGVSSEGTSVVHWVCGTTGSGQGPIYQVLTGGTIVACNVYGENSGGRTTILNAANCNGTLVVDGGRLIGDAVQCDLSTFTGLFTLTNLSLATNKQDGTQNGTIVMGNNSLFLGVTFPNNTPYTVGAATQYAVLSPRQTQINASGQSAQLPEATAGITDIPGYLRSHLAPLRAVKPVNLVPTANVPSGQTQLMLISVRTDQERIGYNFVD